MIWRWNPQSRMPQSKDDSDWQMQRRSLPVTVSKVKGQINRNDVLSIIVLLRVFAKQNKDLFRSVHLQFRFRYFAVHIDCYQAYNGLFGAVEHRCVRLSFSSSSPHLIIRSCRNCFDAAPWRPAPRLASIHLSQRAMTALSIVRDADAYTRTYE